MDDVARRTAERVAALVVRYGRCAEGQSEETIAGESALASLATASARGLDLFGGRAGRAALRIVDPSVVRPDGPPPRSPASTCTPRPSSVAETALRLERVCRYLDRSGGYRRAVLGSVYMVLRGQALDARVDAVLERAGAYFMGQSPLHRAAEDIAARLDEAGIDYAIAGALSLGVHGYERMTDDVDVLITREGLAKFKEAWLGRGYVNLRSGGKAVRDTYNDVKIDFLLTGEFPGDGKPKPVAMPHPIDARIAGPKYRVLSLARVVELKLASGMTAPHRLKDLADVQELIRKAGVPRALADDLHPYVRAKFLELWDLAQHVDDEY